MGYGERFPGWESPRDIKVQIVGPESGNCDAILTGIRNYLNNNRFAHVEIVTLSNSSIVKNEINSADASVFLFLHPVHTPQVPNAKQLNKAVMDGAEYWLLSNPTSSDNTVLVFEGLDNDIVNDIADRPEYTRKRLSSVPESYVGKNEIETMRRRILSQCKTFEL